MKRIPIGERIGIFLEERIEHDLGSSIAVKTFNDQFNKFERTHGLRASGSMVISREMRERKMSKETVRRSDNADSGEFSYIAYLEIRWKKAKS